MSTVVSQVHLAICRLDDILGVYLLMSREDSTEGKALARIRLASRNIMRTDMQECIDLDVHAETVLDILFGGMKQLYVAILNDSYYAEHKTEVGIEYNRFVEEYCRDDEM
jgi:hypothetical protein